MIFEAAVTKAWPQPLEGGDTPVFLLDGVPDRAFLGASDWLPLLLEAVELRTRVRVTASVPSPVPCGDPLCGDGCCDDTDCTNVPEDERRTSFVLRADTIEWL